MITSRTTLRTSGKKNTGFGKADSYVDSTDLDLKLLIQAGIDKYHPVDVPQESRDNEQTSGSDFSDRHGEVAQAQLIYLQSNPPCTSVSQHPARYSTPRPDLGGSSKMTNQRGEDKPGPVIPPISKGKLPSLVLQCPRIIEEIEDLSSLIQPPVLINESLGSSETSDATVKPFRSSTTSVQNKKEPAPPVRPPPLPKI